MNRARTVLIRSLCVAVAVTLRQNCAKHTHTHRERERREREEREREREERERERERAYVDTPEHAHPTTHIYIAHQAPIECSTFTTPVR